MRVYNKIDEVFTYLFIKKNAIEEGASETKLSKVFERANQDKSSIIILDEIDMIAGKLTSKKASLDMRISSILMSLIDGLNSGVFVMGLTSRLHAVDPSFLRSGRLDDVQEIVIKLPEQRYDVLNIITQGKFSFKKKNEMNTIIYIQECI